jgi:high-affinity nickel-transport protein
MLARVLSLLGIVLLGLFLGMRHATDADHVVAVATIVSRHRSVKAAGVIGAAWGLGHTLTIVVVGGAIIALGWTVPARVELSMELAVGAMLVALGLVNLRGARHGHPSAAHPHLPDATALVRLDRRLGPVPLYQLLRPLVVGVVHGLAGSAAAALLVLTVIQEPRWALAYLAVFGAGTIAGMMLITMALALPLAAVERRPPWIHRALRSGAGVVSIVFGLLMAYDIGLAW